MKKKSANDKMVNIHVEDVIHQILKPASLRITLHELD